MMISTAATTLSRAIVAALSVAAFTAQAEQSKAPTPTLHGLSNSVSNHESRIATLEAEMAKLNRRGFQQTAYQAGQNNSPRTYIIQTGDTVSEIARRHNVARSALMSANNLKEGQQIYIGDELIIPSSAVSNAHHDATLAHTKKAPKKPVTEPSPTNAPAPVKPSSAGAQFVTYKVKQGDSLSSIARRNKVSVDAIVRANNLRNANRISINQSLKIPVAGSANVQNQTIPAPTYVANTPAPTPETSADEFGAYTIQKGDTLWSLARDFFTTQQEIQQLNKMGRSTILRPGQELIVPTKKYFEYHNRLTHSG